MKGRRILGIIVVMAVVLTAIPVMAGEVEATSGNDYYVPSYLVIVRTPYDQDGSDAPLIDARVGNASQDDRFGVEVVVYVDHYDYVQGTGEYKPDSIFLSVTGIGIKGKNVRDFKIRWLEIDVAKFSFEDRGSHTTPHATDYNASLDATADSFAAYGLHCEDLDTEIGWFSEISGIIASTATSIATSEGGPVLSTLTGEAVGWLVSKATKHALSQDAPDYINQDNALQDPWTAHPNQYPPYTYMALRGGVNGQTEDPDKVLLARNLRWDMYDGINDRVHVLTLKATLCYAMYGFYYDEDGQRRYGWYNEHKISTSATIYVAPQNMVRVDASGNNVIEISKSDPDNYHNSYFLKVENHISWGTSHYSETMPSEDSTGSYRCDTSAAHKVNLLLGNDEDDNLLDITEHYYY